MASTAALPVVDLPHSRNTVTTNDVNGTKPNKSSFTTNSQITASSDNGDSAYNALITSLPSTNTAPLWEQMTALNPRLPAPKTVPHVWRYVDVRPQLLKAGQVVPEEKAERRVLMFVNPGRGTPPYTTETLYAGLQLVNPGEVAPAHRHVAVATRFVVEAPSSSSSSPSFPSLHQDEDEDEKKDLESDQQHPQTAFTAIQGRRIPMHRHDLLVTPRWTWHDHGNRGASPVVWLDGLDLPSFQHVPVHFVEHYAAPRYPAAEARRDDCAWVVPWERMKGELDRAARGVHGEGKGKAYVERRYQKPGLHGGEISTVLGAMAARLAAGSNSPRRRETSSAVWHVVRGSGWTDVDGERLAWTAGDTFAVPAWCEWRHGTDSNGGEEEREDDSAVYLYRFDDIPMLRALGWYRTDGDDVEALADE